VWAGSHRPIWTFGLSSLCALTQWKNQPVVGRGVHQERTHSISKGRNIQANTHLDECG
jgi:hypothetical protein